MLALLSLRLGQDTQVSKPKGEGTVNKVGLPLFTPKPMVFDNFMNWQFKKMHDEYLVYAKIDLKKKLASNIYVNLEIKFF